jgi:hypothetical protein
MAAQKIRKQLFHQQDQRSPENLHLWLGKRPSGMSKQELENLVKINKLKAEPASRAKLKPPSKQ